MSSLPQLTSSEFDALCRLTCPHCLAGIPARYRIDTNEFVHDEISGPAGKLKGHTLCLANGMRRKFKELVNE